MLYMHYAGMDHVRDVVLYICTVHYVDVVQYMVLRVCGPRII